MLRAGVLAIVVVASLGCSASSAKVLIEVDLSSQRMHVVMPDGSMRDWPISSGRRNHETPTGNFSVQRLDADHHSDEYDGAAMPFAVFFDLKGHAIHGTSERGLGAPLSHGCIRLATRNAAELFSAVKNEGAAISIFGDAPSKRTAAAMQGDGEEPFVPASESAEPGAGQDGEAAWSDSGAHDHFAPGDRETGDDPLWSDE